MRIGILTFHGAENYGALWQAYGLQEYLRSLGHEVSVVDYVPEFIRRQDRVFRPDPDLPPLKRWLRAALVAGVRWRRNRLFRRFRTARLRLAALDLADTSNAFEAFVFGSDQIWNPVLMQGADPVYLGRFPAARGRRLVAYAASMGSMRNLDGDMAALLRECLPRFSAVSVREPALADCLMHDFGCPATVVCDPVFLVGRAAFDSIAVRPRFRRPYLLLFLLSRDSAVLSYARRLAARRGLDVVNVATYEDVCHRALRSQVSPERFLGYIKYASVVVTTSFHVTALSLLFERDFLTVRRGGCSDERVLSLLRTLGVEDRLVNVGSCPSVRPLDYAAIKDGLAAQQRHSRAFLSRVF